MTVRLFVALTPPPDVRGALHEAAAPLRAALADAVRWTEADKLHVTVRFLGEQPDEVPGALLSRLGPAVRPQPAPRLAAAGAGAFPTLRRPRVLWIGLAPNPRLDPLYESVERACDAAGLGRERRPWHPHVTLGRVRGRARIDARALARAAEAVRPDVTFTVNTVDLMRSELAPAGARYTRLGACPLEGG